MRGYERIKDLDFILKSVTRNHEGKYYTRWGYLNDNPFLPSVLIKYKPKGYWSDVVSLWVDFKRDGNKLVVKDCRIKNSSGGQNGELSVVDTVDNLIKCLKHARNTALKFENFEWPYEIEEVE